MKKRSFIFYPFFLNGSSNNLHRGKKPIIPVSGCTDIDVIHVRTSSGVSALWLAPFLLSWDLLSRTYKAEAMTECDSNTLSHW